MALSYVQINKNNGTAAAGASTTAKALIIGPANSGIKETNIYTFANTSDVNSNIGYGNAALAAQLFLQYAPTGFGSVDVLVASASTAGSVTQVSAASPIITLAGTPVASYDFRCQVTTAGNSGSLRFNYSLDGGNTYTDYLAPTTSTSGAFVISNTGLTISFGPGTHAVGNETHYDVLGPTMTTTDLASCITTLSTSNTNYTVIAVADDNPNPVTCAGLFTAMDTHLTSLNNTYYKPTMAVVNVGGETKKFNRSVANTPGTYKTANVLANITGSATSVGNFAVAVAEKVNTYIAVPQPGYARPRLPFAFAIASAVHNVGTDYSVNPAQFTVPGVETPSYDEQLDGSVYADERIVAPQTKRGLPGIWMNKGVLKYNPATANSFNLIPKGRVMNRASEIVRTAITPFLHTRVGTLVDGTGRIQPIYKTFIESTVLKQLNSELINVINGAGQLGHVSGLSFTVNGENNILSSGQLQCILKMTPFGYVDSIVVNMYFDLAV